MYKLSLKNIIKDYIIEQKSINNKNISQSLLLKNLVKDDQYERNNYIKFVADNFDGDYEKGAKAYADIHNRDYDNVFNDRERIKIFINTDFDFEKFSEDDWENYWLMAQHSDEHLDFQEKALENIVKYQGKDNDNYRYLFDRISCHKYGKQKYNTQDICKKDK